MKVREFYMYRSDSAVRRVSVNSEVLFRPPTMRTLLTLALAMALGEPANVVSLGLHQEYGACAVPDIDLSGYARTKYLCQAELDEDFHFGCVRQSLPPAQPKWYTICGKQHSNYGLYAGVTATLGALSGAMLTWMLLGVGGRRVTRAQQAKKD
jgi:hypothetical protein